MYQQSRSILVVSVGSDIIFNDSIVNNCIVLPGNAVDGDVVDE